MKNLILFLSLFLVLPACNPKTGVEEKTQETKINLVSIEDFLSNPEEYAGQVVKVKGLVTHVCKHGGQKLFITNSDNEKHLRIDVGGNIAEFDISLEGSEAEFTGLVQLMDENFIAQSEKEHKEHHGDEKEGEGVHQEMKKNYHLIAKSFATP